MSLYDVLFGLGLAFGIIAIVFLVVPFLFPLMAWFFDFYFRNYVDRILR